MRLIDADALDLDREVELADDWKTAHEIANCVKYAPTVDAAPVVHGEWIGEHGEHVPLMNGIPADSCSCSICGEWLVASDEYGTLGYYCPNCGAKMDLEDEQ